MVIAFLPVEKTIFPMPTVVEPFAGGVSVLVGELVQLVVVASFSGLRVYAMGCKGIIDDTAHRDTADDDDRIVIPPCITDG